MKEVVLDEVGEYHLDRAVKLLAGISDGVYRAVGSALKRSAQHGLTVGMKIVSKEYAISQGDLKSYTQHRNTIVSDGDGNYCVTFGYRGNVIPLIRFDTKFGKDGKIQTRALRANTRKTLDHAFVAQMNGHTGIYERLGDDRLPIEEKFGPSAVHAFYEHEETVDKMDQAIRATYEVRIDHEIDRILNGWGGK